MRSRTRSGSCDHVDTGDQHPPGTRAQETAQDADDRRLAGAVRSEETHDFAAGDAKAHVIDGDEGAKSLDQIFDDDLRLARFAAAFIAAVLRFRASATKDVFDARRRRSQYPKREHSARATPHAIAESEIGVVNDDVNAVADQNGLRSRLAQRGNRLPHLAAGGRRNRRASAPGILCLSTAGVSQ